MPAKGVVMNDANTTPVRIRPDGALIEAASPAAMLAAAIEHGVDTATIGRMLDLQERYDAMQGRKAYVEAMTAFKRDVPSVLRKDARVDFTSSKGRTHYKHATLGGIVNQITTAMSKHGLSASWETKQATGVVTVTCHITHAAGHRESVTLCGPPDDSGNKNAIQMIGSSVTYLQRYTLLSALGLATGDQDDADDLGGTERKAPPPPTRKAAPASAPAPRELTGDGADPFAADSGNEQVEGLVEAISAKPSKSGQRYGIKIGDAWYNTFSDTVAGIAKALKAKGDAVRLAYRTNDRGYHDIVEHGIEAVGEAQQPREPVETYEDEALPL